MAVTNISLEGQALRHEPFDRKVKDGQLVQIEVRFSQLRQVVSQARQVMLASSAREPLGQRVRQLPSHR